MTDTPIQVWIRKNGEMGIWPDQSSLSLEEVGNRLKLASRSEDLEVRLLCEPNMEFRDWSPAALSISKYARQLRLAPIPPK